MNKFVVLIGIACIFLIHNLDGVYGDGECPSDEIDKLNAQIEETLSKYPERKGSLTLSDVYYDNYERLKRSKLSATAKQSDCDSSKKAIEMFLEIAPDFDKVIGKMEQAVDALSAVEQDNNASTEHKYNALSIKSAIKYSTTIQEAEESLERYEAFKKENNMAR